MTNQELVRDKTICTRKERRYKISEDSPLRCETTLAQCGLRRGTVIDLSKSGVRLLCDGNFEVGQPIFTELTTDKSHGIYQGLIRRVEPWVGGQSVIGCSLEDPIPERVLRELASSGAINRRSDDRVELDHKAKVTWPLSQTEVDVELKDFSSGGMKIRASAPIPDDVRLRFHVECNGEEDLIVEAKSVWVEPGDAGCVAGVTFTQRDTPVEVAQSLGIADFDANVDAASGRSYRALGGLVLVGAAAACYLVFTLL